MKGSACQQYGHNSRECKKSSKNETKNTTMVLNPYQIY